MFPYSIRWRLPLSYAAIALLATIALGGVLLTTLRGYYDARERDYLTGNARGISVSIRQMYHDGLSPDAMTAMLGNYAFVSRARVRLLDTHQAVIADTGSMGQDNFITFKFDERAAPFSGAMMLSSTIPAAPAQPPDMLMQEPFEVELSPQGDTMALPVVPTYTVSLFGSPFGYRFNAEDSQPGMISDQQVRIPIFSEDQTLMGFVELSEGPAYGTEVIDSVGRALILASAVAVLLAAGVGWIMSRTITAPVLALTHATGRMAEGQLSARVKLKREDEFGTLARTFNEMAHRVEHTVLTLRRFVADAAHELHTPLTAVHTNLELALTDPHEQNRLAYIERAQGQLKRLETLTNGLLDLARLETDTRKEADLLDLVPLLRQSGEMYASRAEQAGLSLYLELPEQPVLIQGHEGQLVRVIHNLLDNALKFTPEEGAVYLGLRQVTDSIEMWVKDTGIGIPAEDVPQLFSRFHRGRNAAAYPGNGLGLAIIKTIIEGHGGQITLDSSQQGTQFLVRLPKESV